LRDETGRWAGEGDSAGGCASSAGRRDGRLEGEAGSVGVTVIARGDGGYRERGGRGAGRLGESLGQDSEVDEAETGSRLPGSGGHGVGLGVEAGGGGELVEDGGDVALASTAPLELNGRHGLGERCEGGCGEVRNVAQAIGGKALGDLPGGTDGKRRGGMGGVAGLGYDGEVCQIRRDAAGDGEAGEQRRDALGRGLLEEEGVRGAAGGGDGASGGSGVEGEDGRGVLVDEGGERGDGECGGLAVDQRGGRDAGAGQLVAGEIVQALNIREERGGRGWERGLCGVGVEEGAVDLVGVEGDGKGGLDGRGGAGDGKAGSGGGDGVYGEVLGLGPGGRCGELVGGGSVRGGELGGREPLVIGGAAGRDGGGKELLEGGGSVGRLGQSQGEREALGAGHRAGVGRGGNDIRGDRGQRGAGGRLRRERRGGEHGHDGRESSDEGARTYGSNAQQCNKGGSHDYGNGRRGFLLRQTKRHFMLDWLGSGQGYAGDE
jgi:collagen type III alpha